MRALILAPFSERWLDCLRALGAVTYENWLETGRIYDPEELGARLAESAMDILIVEADFVFEEIFEAASDLRMVGICRNSLNQVDIDSATEHSVIVTHAAGRNTNAVAEMTLGLMLALARQIPRAHSLVAGGGWRDPVAGYRQLRGSEIQGSTVGVVGLGKIGREVARKALALGARVLVFDPFVDSEEIQAAGAEAASIEEMAANSDWVTVHVPAEESTAQLINESVLMRMKPTAHLVNTSGGSVVDTPALVEALEHGRIAGAALDVFDGHPLPLSSPLLSAPNVILTPHIGGATRETVERQSQMMVEEVERLLAGTPLRYAVNPEVDPARAH